MTNQFKLTNVCPKCGGKIIPSKNIGEMGKCGDCGEWEPQPDWAAIQKEWAQEREEKKADKISTGGKSMKDQYGKPDTCDKCIHYDVSSQICKQTKASPYAYETCPVPEKIQAPSKDPMKLFEIALDFFLCHTPNRSNINTESIMELAKKHWPKDKPNQEKREEKRGDIDKAWEELKNLSVLSKIKSLGVIETNKPNFKKALKAGDFI